MGGIIKQDRSVVPACDVQDLGGLEKLVKATAGVEGIGAYKVGFELVITYGLPAVVESIKAITDLPVIYDHQKAATDIPDTGAKFARACKAAKVDAVILFPLTGPKTEDAWIGACKKEKLGVIVGGEMTHPGFKESEGGYIEDSACTEIYKRASKQGIRDFVIPGNRLDRIKVYRDLLDDVKPVFYSPGLVAQGGKITDSAKAAGDRWHAIVGRGIYQAKDMEAAARELTKELI